MNRMKIRTKLSLLAAAGILAVNSMALGVDAGNKKEARPSSLAAAAPRNDQGLFVAIPDAYVVRGTNLLELKVTTSDANLVLRQFQFWRGTTGGPLFVSLALTNPDEHLRLDAIAKRDPGAVFQIVVNQQLLFEGKGEGVWSGFTNPSAPDTVFARQRDVASPGSTSASKSSRARTMSSECESACYDTFDFDFGACDGIDPQCTRDARSDLQLCLCYCQGGTPASCCPNPPSTSQELRGSETRVGPTGPETMCFYPQFCVFSGGDAYIHFRFVYYQGLWEVARSYCTGEIISETYLGQVETRVEWTDWQFYTCCQ